MRSDMKTVVHDKDSRKKLLHIEAEGCIINIRVGLTDSSGHSVTHVEVKADQDKDNGPWKIEDGDEQLEHLAFRVVKQKKGEG